MTRETKIGLLMGLGFIVVFAVLLLQTGKRQTADDLAMLINQQNNSVANRPETSDRLPERASGEPAVSASESVPEALTQASDPWTRALPAPPVFGPKPDYSDLGPGNSQMTETLMQPRPSADPATIQSVRVAPVNDVQPTKRPDTPTPSPRPAPANPTPQPSPSAPADSTDKSNDVKTPGTYVVQKGDSLVKIASKHYNSSSTQVLDFLVRSNNDRLRDRHRIIEGQKLLIPVLPAHLIQLTGGTSTTEATTGREPVRLESPEPPAQPKASSGLRTLEAERMAPPPEFRVGSRNDLSDRGTPDRDVSAGEVEADSRASEPRNSSQNKRSSDTAEKSPADAGSSGRTAPGSTASRQSSTSGGAKSSGSDKSAASGAKSDGGAYRWYTIQPKDTLRSIAGKELGGVNNWEEIAKLNKDLKATRLKAGDKIRLPKTKPAPESTRASKRSST